MDGAHMDTCQDKYDNLALKEQLGGLERQLICEALRISHGNKAKAARMLGITERIMGLRVAKYQIDPAEYRTER